MEPTDFYFFIAPLGSLVVILVLGLFYFARKEERIDRELKQIKREFRSGAIDKKGFEQKKKNLKKNRLFTQELERLQTMRKDKSIDQETYVRLKKIIAQAQSQH
jgi:hypothetical protein